MRFSRLAEIRPQYFVNEVQFAFPRREDMKHQPRSLNSASPVHPLSDDNPSRLAPHPIPNKRPAVLVTQAQQTCVVKSSTALLPT